MSFNKSAFLSFCISNQYLPQELQEFLEKKGTYFTVITAIYKHSHPNIIKKSMSEKKRDGFPRFLERMFLTHQKIICDVLEHYPDAIVSLLSFSCKTAKKAYFADPDVRHAVRYKWISRLDSIQLCENQFNYMKELHGILKELYQSGVEVRDIITNRFKRKLSTSPQELNYIFNELIDDRDHKLSIIQKLLPLNLGCMANILQPGSINHENVDYLIWEITRARGRVKYFQAISYYTQATRHYLSIDELRDCFANKWYLLMGFSSIYGDDYLNEVNTRAFMRGLITPNYMELWYQSIYFFIKNKSIVNDINTGALDRIIQLYHTAPNMVLSILPLLADKNHDSNIIENLMSFPVCYFLFDEQEGDPNDKFQQITQLNRTQRNHFESILIVYLLQNKLISIDNVLTLKTWQRHYLEIASVNSNFEFLMDFLELLPDLDKPASKQFIAEAFQITYHLNKHDLPQKQQENISCVELREFFKNKSLDDLLNCSDNDKRDIKIAYFRSLIAKQADYKRILDHIPVNDKMMIVSPERYPILGSLSDVQVFQRQNIQPIVAEKINYNNSTHNNVVEKSTKRSIERINKKYRNKSINPSDTYGEIAKIILDVVYKKQKEILLSHSKQFLEENKNTDDKMVLSNRELSYFINYLLLTMMASPDHRNMLNNIIKILHSLNQASNNNDYYHFLTRMVSSVLDISFQENIQEWVIDAKLDYCLSSDDYLIKIQGVIDELGREIMVNYHFTDFQIYQSLLFSSFFFLEQDVNIFSEKYDLKYFNDLNIRDVRVPVNDLFKSYVVMKTFFSLIDFFSNPDNSKPEYLPFTHYWFELQEEGARRNVDIADNLFTTLFEIGSTYALDDDEKNLLLIIKNEQNTLDTIYGFALPCPEGLANKFIEKLVSISPLANILFVNSSLIKIRLSNLISEHSVGYLLSLDSSKRKIMLAQLIEHENNSNLEPPVTLLWGFIKPNIIDMIINEFKETNPGVSLINDELNSKDDEERADYILFKGVIDNYMYIEFDLNQIITVVRQKDLSMINQTIKDIIQTKAIEYLSIDNAALYQKKARDIWDEIKTSVIKEIAVLFGHSYPEIILLDETASRSSRELFIEEQDNVNLFKGYIDDAWELIIDSLITDSLSASGFKRFAESKNLEQEPPVKRHRNRFFQASPDDNLDNNKDSAAFKP